jgi:membrane-associated phospholipid phosphatase
LAFGIIIMTSIALPFYIFFPVNEVWVSNPEYYNVYSDFSTNVVNILREVREGEAVTQVFSNVNNCFPSMHTAISVFIALTLIVNRRKYLAPIYTFVAASIVTATVYLGIHWITDIVAGIILALSVTFLLYYLDFNFRFRMKYLKHYEFPFRIENATWRGRPLKWKRKRIDPSKSATKKLAGDYNLTKYTTKKGKLLMEGPNLLIRKIGYILLAIICIILILVLNYLPFIPDAALRYMVYFLGMTLLIIGLIFSVQKAFFQRTRLYKNGLAPTQIPKKYWFSTKEFFIPYLKIKKINHEYDWVDITTKSGELARVFQKYSGEEIFNEIKGIIKKLKKAKKKKA